MWKFIVDVVHDFVSSLQPDVGRGFLHVSNVFLLNMGLLGDGPKCGMLMYPDHLQNDSILASIGPVSTLLWPKNLVTLGFSGILRGKHGNNGLKCGILIYWILSSLSLVLG